MPLKMRVLSILCCTVCIAISIRPSRATNLGCGDHLGENINGNKDHFEGDEISEPAVQQRRGGSRRLLKENIKKTMCLLMDSVEYVGGTLPNGVLRNVPSAGRCCLRCQLRRGCTRFTYYGSTRSCELKRASSSAKRSATRRVKAARGVVSGVVPAAPTVCELQYAIDYAGGTLANGVSYGVYVYRDCCALCLGRADCFRWTWSGATFTCKLKGSSGWKQTAAKSKKLVSGKISSNL
jgi:hypothetical protein